MISDILMRHYQVSPVDILQQWFPHLTEIAPNSKLLVSAMISTVDFAIFHVLFIIYHSTEANSSAIEREERHKELVGETAEVGLMFASKAFVQLLANPIVGPLTHKLVEKST